MALLVAGYLTAAELVMHTAMAHRPRRYGLPRLSTGHRRHPH